MFAGLEDGIAAIIAFVAVLTAGGAVHLLVATQAADMVGGLEARLVAMVNRWLLIALLFECFRGKWICNVAALAADHGLGATVFVTAGTVRVGYLGTGGVVVTEAAVFQFVDVCCMVKTDRCVVLLN